MPERFAPEQANNHPAYAYISFGGGQRICIGRAFAMTEAQLILATIVQHYQFYLVPEPLITLRPRHGVLVNIQPK